MAKRLNILLIMTFFTILLITPLLNAQPPFQQIAGENGINIGFFGIDVTKMEETLDFNTQIFNTSTGLILTNVTTDCFLHLHNFAGNHIIEDKMNFNATVIEFYYIVDGGNFSNVGEYSYLYWCNNSVGGGFVTGLFEVTLTGVEFTTARAVIYSIFFLILIFTFSITIFGIYILPPSNAKDEQGKIISINNLKYLRGVLWMFAWMLIIAMFYISSNLAFAYLGEELFAKFLFALFSMGLSVTPVIVILWFIWILVQIFQDEKIRKFYDRGIIPGAKL